MVRRVSDDLLSAALRHSVLLQRASAGEVREILRLLETAYPEILERITTRLDRIQGRGFDKGPHTTKRLKDLLDSIRDMLREAMIGARGKLTSDLGSIAKLEASWQSRILGGPLQIEVVAPSAVTLRSIATSRPFQGALLKDWFNGLTRSVQAKVQQQINLGIVEGESTDAIVRRLKGTRAAGFSDGVLGESRRQVQSVVRTAVNHVTTQARDLTYEGNKDLIKGVQYVATLDSRTTKICASLDGKVFPIGEGPRPPQHYGCRSTTIPILKSAKELGLNTIPEGTRASFTGQVPARTTYSQWLRSQSREVQEEVLGKRGAALFRGNRLKLDKFIGADGRPLTIDQLEKLTA